MARKTVNPANEEKNAKRRAEAEALQRETDELLSALNARLGGARVRLYNDGSRRAIVVLPTNGGPIDINGVPASAVPQCLRTALAVLGATGGSGATLDPD